MLFHIITYQCNIVGYKDSLSKYGPIRMIPCHITSSLLWAAGTLYCACMLFYNDNIAVAVNLLLWQRPFRVILNKYYVLVPTKVGKNV